MLRVSPDRRNIVYIAKEGKVTNIFINDKNVVTSKDYIEDILFNPDSKRFAYTAYSDNGGYVVSNGKKYDVGYKIVSDMEFSTDGEHISYRAKDTPATLDSAHNNEYFIVIDDRKVTPYCNAFSSKYVDNRLRFVCYDITVNQLKIGTVVY